MRLLITPLLFFLAVQAPAIFAKEEPLYLVEMVFFLHTNEDNKQAENWPKDISLQLKTPQAFLVNDSRERIYPEILNEKADQDGNAYPTLYRYRKDQEAEAVFPEGIELALRDKAKKINSVARYQFIEHIAFAQRIDARFKNKANNIVINIEDTSRKTEQAFTIAGSFSLYKTRFLHLNTNLWISYFNKEGEQQRLEKNAEPIEADSIDALLAEASVADDATGEDNTKEIEATWPLIPEIPQFFKIFLNNRIKS